MENWQVVLFAVCLSFSISVIQSKNWGLYKVGIPFYFVCNSSDAFWAFGNTAVADCEKCEKPTCQVYAAFESRINATCDKKKKSSRLDIAYLKISDSSKVRCGTNTKLYYELFLGDYSEHLRPEGNSLFAFDQSSYTLVCDRDYSSEMVWYAKRKVIIGNFKNSSCDNSASLSTISSSRLHFSCDEKTKVMKLKIDPIRYSLDDKVNIACRNGDKLSFFDLEVRVPVENVTIKSLNQTGFVEGRREKFNCVAVRSKPAATIWWFLTHQNGSEIRILDPVKNETTQIKDLFQTVSTLELLLKREYRNIMCQARIENTKWKKSPYVPLEIKYAPKGNPVINFGKSVLFAGDSIEINCEWNGGIPEATLKLSCLSKYKEAKSSVTVEGNVTKDMDGSICRCDGIHIERNESATEKINVFYTPEITVVVNATDLHQRAFLRCDVQANPTKFVFKIVQKWGNTTRREIDSGSIEFPSFSHEDFGTWVCRVNSGVPSNNDSAEQSMELQVPVRPLIKGKTAEIAKFRERKSLKLCFYCYPEATDVKWFKDGELISSLKYSEEPADDGLFPFSGNCSVLEVNTEDQKLVHNFSLVVTNSVGQSSLPVVLLIDPPDSIAPIIYPAVICVLGTILVSLIIVGVVYSRTQKLPETN